VDAVTISYGVNTAASVMGALDVGSDGTITTYSYTSGASAAANTVAAITAGTISGMDITTGDGTGSLTFASLAAVTTLGAVVIDTDDTITFTIGATGATTIDSITVTSKASDVNLGTWGADGSGTSGTVGDITFKGSSSTGTDLIIEAVLSVGAVSTAAATAGTYTITLDDDTVIGTTMTGGDGIDIFTGTGGADVISTGAAADTLNGGSGDDTLTDAAGASSASGGAGADTISMGAGNDSINGGAGNDTITGGAGTDTIVAADDAANGLDTVVLNVVDGTTILDIIDLQANGAFVEGATEDVKVITDVDVTSAVGDEADGDNILILTGDFFANAAALVTATTLFAAMDTGDIVIIYSSDATSDARLAVATIDAAGDITAATDNIIFTGLTVAEAATGFANANFVI
jgi:Ca2+-binding RTX toxin-like protein